mmetsp:Transcript_32201/g.99253  ORF Transcript_32201/g.99253 Transcript_32201/m.99253 type:complete len:233 (+) Transcript_32201:744-1442(+)
MPMMRSCCSASWSLQKPLATSFATSAFFAPFSSISSKVWAHLYRSYVSADLEPLRFGLSCWHSQSSFMKGSSALVGSSIRGSLSALPPLFFFFGDAGGGGGEEPPLIARAASPALTPSATCLAVRPRIIAFFAMNSPSLRMPSSNMDLALRSSATLMLLDEVSPSLSALRFRGFFGLTATMGASSTYFFLSSADVPDHRTPRRFMICLLASALSRPSFASSSATSPRCCAQK